MPWIQLRINTNSDDAETISDLLMEEGSVSITFEDGKDTPIFEPKLGETPLWRDTVVVALFEADTDLTPTIEMLKTLPFLGDNFSHKIEQIEDKDWCASGWITSILSNLALVYGFAQAGAKSLIQPQSMLSSIRSSLRHRHSPNHCTVFRVVRQSRFKQ